MIDRLVKMAEPEDESDEIDLEEAMFIVATERRKIMPPKDLPKD